MFERSRPQEGVNELRGASIRDVLTRAAGRGRKYFNYASTEVRRTDRDILSSFELELYQLQMDTAQAPKTKTFCQSGPPKHLSNAYIVLVYQDIFRELPRPFIYEFIIKIPKF